MNWHNVSKKEPCPVCHHDSWCTVSDDGGMCVCRRVESDRPAKSGIGWIHRLKDEGTQVASRHAKLGETCAARPLETPSGLGLSPSGNPTLSRGRIPTARTTAPTPQLRFAQLSPSGVAAEHFAALPKGDIQVRLCRYLMRELSIPCDMLAAMDVRWDAAAKAAAFPMRDAEGKVTGIRYRQLKTAKKWALKGSKDGLFFIPGFIPLSEEIVVCEGPTDMLAAASVGLNAVGRSACLTGAALLRDFIKRHRVRRVTIIADDDPPKSRPGGGTWRPGIYGAKKLAADLGIAARIVLPFPGFKDIREWYAKGGLTKKKFETAAKTANWCLVPGA